MYFQESFSWGNFPGKLFSRGFLGGGSLEGGFLGIFFSGGFLAGILSGEVFWRRGFLSWWRMVFCGKFF